VLGWIAENYIRYLVQWQSGAAALGLMIVGWSLGRRCAAVASTLVTTASFPLAARLLNDNRRDEAMRQLQMNAAMMVAVLLPVTAALELLGGTLVDLFVAADYRAITTEILGLSVLAGAIRNLHMHTTDQLMVLERRIGMLAKVDLFEIVLCAGLSLAGLVLEGVRGAVIGQALGSLATLALSMFLARRHLGFVWPWADTAKIVGATAAMSLVLYTLHAEHDMLGLGLASVVGTLAYALACAVIFAPALRRLLAARRQTLGSEGA
jgi:O-antigen/teichoic acid export membrane protein